MSHRIFPILSDNITNELKNLSEIYYTEKPIDKNFGKRNVEIFEICPD